MVFDLFKLHSKEDVPNSWIWAKFNSELLRKKFLCLLKKSSQKKVAERISKYLHAGVSTIEKHLIRLKYSKEKVWLPLPVIIQLVNLINKRGLKEKIINNIAFFLCKTSPTKQKIKSVKNLNKILAKFIGAHIADGNLKLEGHTCRLKISDGREDLVESASKWIKEIFGFNSIIRFNKKDNTYNCLFNNKIIGRYITNIFKVPSGKKCYIVKEPELIKKSSFKIRKAFALGVFTFDGGIKSSGMVALSSMSKQLVDDINDILLMDGIKVNKKHNKKKRSWLIESVSGRNPSYLKKWLDYFEKDTWKYKRLKFFISKKRDYSIKELNYLFPKHYLSKVGLNDILLAMRGLNKTKIDKLIGYLNKNNIKISNTSAYKHIHILEKSNLIYKTTEKVTDGKNYWSETIYNLR